AGRRVRRDGLLARAATPVRRLCRHRRRARDVAVGRHAADADGRGAAAGGQATAQHLAHAVRTPDQGQRGRWSGGGRDRGSAKMSSGISLVTSTGGPAEIAETARLCERAGFASVWATEFYDRSATVAMAAIAHATARIEIGSGIAYAFGRTP